MHDCGRWYIDRMSVTLLQPTPTDLPRVIDVVASWQRDGAPVQVHPGDLGWYQRFGAEALAAALRVWVRDEEAVAVGFLDESNLIRMAIAPIAGDDVDVAQHIADDFTGALDRVLAPGRGVAEVRFGHALRRVLADRGWTADDPWVPLFRDLKQSVTPSPLTIRRVGSESVADRVLVEAAAFPGASLTAERWRQMADGYAYGNAECLVGYDENDAPVAATTVWSAGPGRPGVIEPLGVHHDHRGRGHGVAITLAAADALRRMGCSTATVATPSSNEGAVATYLAAGFVTPGEVTDFSRP